jgi:hypothetical protein
LTPVDQEANITVSSDDDFHHLTGSTAHHLGALLLGAGSGTNGRSRARPHPSLPTESRFHPRLLPGLVLERYGHFRQEVTESQVALWDNQLTKGAVVRFRALGVALVSALLAVLLTLIGQPALASAPSIPGTAPTQSSLAAAPTTYKSFIYDNFKHNLQVRTGKTPANCQAHHTMPHKFRDQWMPRWGINYNDPAYGLWWISTTGLANNHGSKAREYNNAWQTFFDINPTATRAQVLTQRSQMVRAYSPYYRC